MTNFEQDIVLPSAPGPVGPANTDRNSSPLWVVNCPIVVTATGGRLRGVSLSGGSR